MILTIHFLLGALIATKIKSVVLIFLLSVSSHYFLDFLPHVEYSIEKILEKRWRESFFDFLKVFLDIFIAIILVFFLTENFLLALLGGIFAALPDGFSLLFFLFPEKKLLEKHYFFHQEIIHFLKKKKISLFWRILSQALIGILIIIFFYL